MSVMRVPTLAVALAIALFFVGTVVADDVAEGDEGEDQLHEPLFQPTLAVGSALIFLCSALAAGGGIGGGGLYLPVFVLVLGYIPHIAIPLSKATILGVAYGGYLVNYSRRHPLADRPLIDYDTALLLQPCLLMGTTIGVNMNVVLPSVIIVGLLISLLSYVSYRTLRKGIRQFKEESATGSTQTRPRKGSPLLMARPDDSSSDHTDSNGPKALDISTHPLDIEEVDVVEPINLDSLDNDLGNGIQPSPKDLLKSQSLPTRGKFMFDFESDNIALLGDSSRQNVESISRSGSMHSNMSPVNGHSSSRTAETAGLMSESEESNFTSSGPDVSVVTSINDAVSSEKSQRLKEVIHDESNRGSWRFTVAVSILAFVILISLFKGGSRGETSVVGVECGSLPWAILMGSTFPVLALVAHLLGRRMVRETEVKQSVNYPYVEGDIIWTRRKAIIYPLVSVLAGVAAGCLGIGGGLVLGPLFLEIGVYPPVITATSAFMIIFSATSITSQFIFLGRLPLTQGAWYCGVGFVGAVIGHKWVKALVQRYKKQSIVSLVLGAAVGLSAVVMIVTQTIILVDDGIDFKFHSLCDKAED